jgi:hypothetical protein
LARPPRRQTYVSTGFIAFSVERWPDLLRRWAEACERVRFEETRAGGAPSWSPFWDADQDALNAVLMSEVEEGAILELPPELAPLTMQELSRVRVIDEGSLRCRIGRRETLMVHYGASPKPWQPGGWRSLRRNPYTQLLPRLLFADDVAVPVSQAELPPWLRPGVTGAALRLALEGLNRLRWWAVLGRGWLIPRLEQRLRPALRRLGWRRAAAG